MKEKGSALQWVINFSGLLMATRDAGMYLLCFGLFWSSLWFLRSTKWSDSEISECAAPHSETYIYIYEYRRRRTEYRLFRLTEVAPKWPLNNLRVGHGRTRTWAERHGARALAFILQLLSYLFIYMRRYIYIYILYIYMYGRWFLKELSYNLSLSLSSSLPCCGGWRPVISQLAEANRTGIGGISISFYNRFVFSFFFSLYIFPSAHSFSSSIHSLHIYLFNLFIHPTSRLLIRL